MSVSKMKKLTVLAYSTDAEPIVRKLMNLRCVELRPVKDLQNAALVRLESDAQKSQIEERLRQIRSIIPILNKYTTRKKRLGRFLHSVNREEFLKEGRDRRAWQTAEAATAAVLAMEESLAERTRAKALMESLTPWLEYDAPLNHEGSQKTALLLGSCAEGVKEETLLESLAQVGAYTEVVSKDDHGTYLALTCHKEDLDAVNRTLVEYGFLKTAFPEVTTTAQVAYDRAEQAVLNAEAEYLRQEELLRDYSEQLDDVEILCDIEATSLEVCLQKRKLSATRNCVVLSGWVPEFMQDRVTDALSQFECACELADPDEEEAPPVMLRNNKMATTFEWVIGMYSYPKYGTFDPTMIMSIFYLIVFGLMFADVGYGLLLTLGCFLGVKLLNPKLGMRRMMLMFGYCGISCMVMGVLFGGWFGNLPTAIMNSFIYHAEGVAETTPIGSFFANGLLFNPINSATGFLVLALGVGQIHLMAGMAINMIETIKRGKVLQAICSTVPFWVLFIGIDLLAPAAAIDMVVSDPASVSAEVRELLATLSDVGLYVTAAGFASILLFNGVGQKSVTSWLVKGLGGWYSLISFASDLLSYSRILALGLVAGVISQVINMMTGVGATGAFGFVFMLIVMIFGHLLNLALNILGTFVHAARLQYIEFFGKFYEDGGDIFTPVLPTEEYSEDPSTIPEE